jgi:hypothetical protein
MKVIVRVCHAALLLVLTGIPTPSRGQVVINEVFLDGADDVIELQNLGHTSVDVASWWICYQPNYHQISSLTVSGSTTVAPGAIITISGASLDLDATQEDVGLYNSSSFTSPAAMEDFVQYGATGDIGRTDVAVAKGIWTLAEAVAAPPVGSSIQYDGTGNGAANWIVSGTPSLGSQNVNATCEAGTVSFVGGGTTRTICVGDGVADPLAVDVSGASSADYGYFITDTMGGILGFSTNATIDLNGAPVGVCRIYGFSHIGAIMNNGMGGAVSNATAAGCHDLSGNYVEVTRIGVDGGHVMHVAGFTNITICLDMDPDPIPVVNTSAYTNMPYAYIVTDDSSMVLAFPAGDTIDLNGATPGVCRIYGINYTGVLDMATGIHVGAVTSSICADLSDNYVRVTRHDTGAGCETNISFAAVGGIVPGNTLSLSIKTMYGESYVLEATDNLFAPDWQPVVNNIVGNGELRELAVPVDPGERSQFYRLLQEEPLHEKVGQSAALSTRAHDVSGTCTIIDNDTIEIRDFVYDGDGVDVQVVLSANAGFSPYTSISHDLRRATPYNGETLTFDLPPTVSLDEVNYISIWCVPFGASFGDGPFN